MALDPATVRRIATLARIRVSEPEAITLMGELNAIFGWIEAGRSSVACGASNSRCQRSRHRFTQMKHRCC